MWGDTRPTSFRLAYVRRSIHLVHSCVRDSQSLIVKAEATFSLPEAELNALVDKIFAFSYIWSIAGSVEGDG